MLRNSDARQTPHGKRRWFHNIASKNVVELYRAIHNANDDFINIDLSWEWPAVVLMPEEYGLRVGGMSVTELGQQLANYWGQGGIPGAKDFHNMIVWSTGGRSYNPALFGHWVNRECTQWLSYFIAKNHTLGAVHAWFAAFSGVARKSKLRLERSLRDIAQSQDAESVEFMESIHRIKFRMSFDVCIKDHHEVVDGLPSLPSNTMITTNEKGMQVIHNSINKMFPRRIWDICANTVIPATWFCGPPCPLTGHQEMGALGVKPVSHAWVADNDRSPILTEANQHMWPIPLPKGVLLEDVRGEMIRLGVRYAWLDVLCLRQRAQPKLGTELAILVSREAVGNVPLRTEIIESTTLSVSSIASIAEVIEGVPYNMEKAGIVERREQRRLEEWKVDVPTIGAIYSNLDQDGLYGGGPIVIFMSGLGRPFRHQGWDSNRHLLRRAWTLQETPDLSKCLIAGLPEECSWGNVRPSSWPWNCKV